MSKIGKINIPIPDKVKVLLSGNTVNVEGPLGKQAIELDLEMFELNITEGKDVSIKPKKLETIKCFNLAPPMNRMIVPIEPIIKAVLKSG